MAPLRRALFGKRSQTFRGLGRLPLGGMALGGWMSGWIFDMTGSYQAAFLNGLAWNLVNVSIMLWLLFKPRRRLAAA